LEAPEQCSTGFVIFEQIEDGDPIATIGYQTPQTEYFIKLPEFYKNEKPIPVESILHEMLHCAGFQHDLPLATGTAKCSVENREHIDSFAISIGKSDYYSLMRYGPGLPKDADFEQPFFKPNSISAGDRAIIKMLYGSKGTHHGEWHIDCLSEACTNQICVCTSCGRLPGGLRGGVNCGYVGRKSHWTCCLSEDELAKCSTTHSGFWHAKCVGSRCSKDGCVCYNCGGGCSYEGDQGHWNCCQQEELMSVCKSSFAKS